MQSIPRKRCLLGTQVFEMISVLRIVLSTVTGGMENVICNLASGRDSAKLEISVACLQELGHLSDKLRQFSVESSLVPRMIPGFSIVYPYRLIRFISKLGCDIVHTHSGCWYKVAAACARIPSMKLIYTEHDGSPSNYDKKNIVELWKLY